MSLEELHKLEDRVWMLEEELKAQRKREEEYFKQLQAVQHEVKVLRSRR